MPQTPLETTIMEVQEPASNVDKQDTLLENVHKGVPVLKQMLTSDKPIFKIPNSSGTHLYSPKKPPKVQKIASIE